MEVFNSFYFYVVFGALSLIMASVYFYIFSKTQERYVKCWGGFFVLFSISMFLLIATIYTKESEMTFAIRKSLDMFNILLLLMGAYSLANRKTPGHWCRFALYMMMWIALAAIYEFDRASLYIPVSMFQLCLTCALCYAIIRYWKLPLMEKAVALLVFGAWGYFKTVVSFIEAMGNNSNNFYLAEIVLSNILNLIILVIFLQRAQDGRGIAEQRFKIIAENSYDVVFYYELNPAKFSYITPSVERLFGYKPAAFLSNPLFHYNLVNSEYLATLEMLFDPDDFYEDASWSKNDTIRMYNRSGRELWCDVLTTLIINQGDAIAVQGRIRDVTELKKTEAELISSKKMRDILLSSISHELKTPITALIAHLVAFKDGKFNDKETERRAIDIMYNKVRMLEHLIHDLFMLTKLETNQFSFDFMVMDGRDIIETLIDNHMTDAEGHGILIRAEMDKEEIEKVRIIADKLRIEQVFVNILSNAIRFSAEGDEITLSMEKDDEKGVFSFSVEDNGPGISEEKIPYIFDRFVKAAHNASGRKNADQMQSTGLGLTIAKEIVNAHKGNIYVRSSKHGSKFTVELPLYLDPY